jgi:polygalacturonase
MRNSALLAFLLCVCTATSAAVFDVKSFGAKGDGKTLDRAAINRAIEAAAAAGGGTVE